MNNFTILFTDWLMVFHMVIPLYVVIALSQFITYLLVQLVGEKERKIKEGMKIMGLRELVFWCSWFNIYAAYVTVLALASTVILFLLGVFNNTNWVLIFLLVLSYSFTVIFFSFMISPFFDKSRVSNYSVTKISGVVTVDSGYTCFIVYKNRLKYLEILVIHSIIIQYNS